MIKRLISQLHFTRQGLLSLALLPAFVYGTLPHTACICADGHREEHCRALGRHASAQKCATKSHCSCCQARQGEPNCCKVSDHQPKPQSWLMAAGTCCHPIVESPTPLAPSVKVQSPEKSTLQTSLGSTAGYWPADSFPVAHWRHLSTPPPLDVVIVYLHLTI